MTLADGQRVGPETLVTNYQSTMKNTPDERWFNPYRTNVENRVSS
jgi:hypothetical protein